MDFISNWFQTASKVIKSPSKALENETRTDGWGYPVRFMIFSVVLAALLRSFALGLEMITSTTVAFQPVNLVFNLLGSIIGGPVTLAIIAAIYHLFAYVLGARNGFSRTFAAVCYGTAMLPFVAVFVILGVFSPILGLGVLTALWTLQIQYRGLQHFQEMSSTRAGLAIIIPILLPLMLATIAAVFYSVTMMSVLA